MECAMKKDLYNALIIAQKGVADIRKSVMGMTYDEHLAVQALYDVICAEREDRGSTKAIAIASLAFENLTKVSYSAVDHFIRNVK